MPGAAVKNKKPAADAGGASTHLSLERVHQLAAELEQHGSTKANNAVRLLSVLTDSRDPDVLKAAMQGLKLFFVDVSHDGDLAEAKRPKVKASAVELEAAAAAAAAAGTPDPKDKAEDVYRQWLCRQYDLYISALLGLLRNAAIKPATQINAVAALMEAVRSEEGAGEFSFALYCKLLRALVTSTAVQPEVFTFLFTRYFQYTDVRFYTLWAVREIASERSKREAKEEQRQERVKAQSKGKGAEPAADAGPSAQSDDVARTLYDVLVNVPDGLGPTPNEGEGQVRGADDQGEITSWCGIEQAGTVRAAVDRNLSSKVRRKRKAQDEASQDGAKGGAVREVVWAGAKAHKRLFSEAWIALLQLSIPADILRKVLLRLHSAVLPRMTNPLLLSDFLTYCLNQGGITGMLALNAIFLLVTQYGLEYPQFYERLYQLITPQAFAAKHRAQFFRLADLFLSSGLVPAYTAASFIKKMARLGMSAPPAGAMAAIAFIHNLIRRHPACMVLLHNPVKAPSTSAEADVEGDLGEESDGGQEGPSGKLGEDVYDVTERDPAKSRAVESSLWELASYRNHYCPQVVALCAVLDKDLTDRAKTSEVDIEPLLGTSYSSLFTQEAERRLKQVPLAFYTHPPTKLFDAGCQDDFGGWVL